MKDQERPSTSTYSDI